MLAASGLFGPAARAQPAHLTSSPPFNDTRVARFNRGDFQRIQTIGSPARRKQASAGSRRRCLATWQARTGRVTSSVVLEGREPRPVFAWQGEQPPLRVALRAAPPGVLNNYIHTP